MTDLRSPYPWFGGKSAVASLVWSRFGRVRNYCEPFFGSGAVLLGRPQPFDGTETVNDMNGWLCNFWRALQADPDSVAAYADNPVSELDLHARGDWLFCRDGVDEFIERLRSDPDYFDAKSAGWWVWGQCCWIGTGWGPRQLPHLGNAGRGVNRKLPHLGDAGMGDDSQTSKGDHLREYMRGLAERVRCVRVCCGDWSRVCGGKSGNAIRSLFASGGECGIFLDPPYSNLADRQDDLYGDCDDLHVANDVREWAIEHGTDKRLRICLCGYAGEGHEVLIEHGWDSVNWKANGGYANQSNEGRGRVNCRKEILFFSPHCLGVSRPVQAILFEEH